MDVRHARSGSGFEAEHTNSGPAKIAPFISPVTRVDAATGVAVQMYRDGDTGEVELQYPSQATVKAYSAPTVEAASAPEPKAEMPMPPAPVAEHQMLVA
jgi:hypothetical protein